MLGIPPDSSGMVAVGLKPSCRDWCRALYRVPYSGWGASRLPRATLPIINMPRKAGSTNDYWGHGGVEQIESDPNSVKQTTIFTALCT